MKELNVKQRLDNLRKIFAEDEENQQVSNIQKNWEEKDRGIKAATTRSMPQHTKNLFRSSMMNKKFNDDQPVGNEVQEDLHTFLVKKIK